MFSCSTCGGLSNPATDTVRVDMARVVGFADNPAEALATQKAAEEVARMHDDLQAARLAEARRKSEELAQQEALEEARKAAIRRADVQRHEEAARAAAARACEAQRAEEEQEAAKLFAESKGKVEELAETQRLEEQSRLLLEFLAEHGFAGAHTPRRKMWRTTYPIHKAVKVGDPKIIEILLAEGADPNQKDSRGKTAEQLAQSQGRKGSCETVQRLLRAAAQPNRGGVPGGA
mmetsp:Transcript_102526/g.265126  ORF Transcript_102526/g.265126 Transcript_102526/m.265126 type:complete len:233 (+) Transcript_102526:98-796(+)